MTARNPRKGAVVCRKEVAHKSARVIAHWCSFAGPAKLDANGIEEKPLYLCTSTNSIEFGSTISPWEPCHFFCQQQKTWKDTRCSAQLFTIFKSREFVIAIVTRLQESLSFFCWGGVRGVGVAQYNGATNEHLLATERKLPDNRYIRWHRCPVRTNLS